MLQTAATNFTKPSNTPSSRESPMSSKTPIKIPTISSPTISSIWLQPWAGEGTRPYVACATGHLFCHPTAGCPTLVAVLRQSGDFDFLLRAPVSGRQGIWFRRFVTDASHLRKQIGHVHSRERFEQRRNLRSHLGQIAGNLVHPRSIA